MAKFDNTQLNRHAKDRFCIECGLKEHKYGLFGQEVRIDDIIHKVVWCICNPHELASFCVGEERIEFKVVHCPPNHGYGSVLRVHDGDHIVDMKPRKAMRSLEKEKSMQGLAE
ncbi:hypothetical protein OEA41_000510 [Lepraria neglecta]|uniref:Uncharacterized protein n=1 Tax=Lepraria neglecta TaxID=209136 RepID=A0AAE0DPV1_9LECA|nr:hypothetical protein OEA41_000510 [Lepraria neglecta]